MEIKNIFIGIVLFTMVSVGIFSFADSLIDNYEVYDVDPIDENYTEMFDNLNILGNLNETSETIYGKFAVDEKPSLTQYFLLAPALLWSIFVTILKIPSSIFNLMGIITSVIGIPGWVLDGFIIIITITFSFLILNAIIKWKT